MTQCDEFGFSNPGTYGLKGLQGISGGVILTLSIGPQDKLPLRSVGELNMVDFALWSICLSNQFPKMSIEIEPGTHRLLLLLIHLRFKEPVCWRTIFNCDLNKAESLDPNCKQPSKTINSVTEFDTELFQTDIRELLQELLELADDSTPVQDDIHNFLLEHFTVSRKTRDKSRRKIPKLAAANQRKKSQIQASATEDHKASILTNPR
ncbi:hypothetical protein ACTXT7_002985 [Hymenolepis weldensis]